MKTNSTQHKAPIAALMLLLSASLISGPVFADKPSWAGADQGKSEQHGNGKGHGKRDKEERGRDDRDGRDDKGDHRDRNDRNDRQVSRSYFTTQQRTVFVDYYSNEFRERGCPPGLAKKKNGCLPPGQAKKWKRGQALPRTVVYEEVPQRVITVIGAPPTGHKFVRVANDILLIAIGTGMIIDAIEDLNR